MLQTKGHISSKHAIVDKANSTMLLTVGIATFVVFFSLVSIRALYMQSTHQSKIISKKEESLDKLKENKKIATELSNTYKAFDSQSPNILGGNPDGTAPLDGKNAKIVIDALPSDYDFPALSSSLEKILKDGGYSIDEIGGREDSGGSAKSSKSTKTAKTNTAVTIPYSFSVRASDDATYKLLQTLEHSIRPMSVRSLDIQANESGLRTTILLNTYYSPEKTFQLGKETVK